MGQRRMNRDLTRSALCFIFLSVPVLTCFCMPQAIPQKTPEQSQTPLVPAVSPYMDLHTHIDPSNPEASVEAAARSMSAQNAARIFLLTEPFPLDDPERYDAEIFLPAAKRYPTKLSVVGGGGTLNAMIIEAARSGKVDPDVRMKFREQAEKLLREGVAGFGEMAALHLVQPSSALKDYEYASPNSALFLLLADIAAENNVPIDLHMEAVLQPMPLPADLAAPNPAQLPADIQDFEELLRHNRKAKIIWAHAGADFTGYRTPELCRRLLKAHSNLYMEIKYDPVTPGRNPVVVDGKIKPEWLKLFQDFPDRFVIGSDQHYRPTPGKGQPRWEATVLILNQLPAGLRQKIGIDNPARIYGGLTKAELSN
jgi:predicted TIM-barrel fold metal-dependent hydrolase